MCEPWEEDWSGADRPGLKVVCLPACLTAVSKSSCSLIAVKGADNERCSGLYERLDDQVDSTPDPRPVYKKKEPPERYLISSGTQWNITSSIGGGGGVVFYSSGGESG